MKHIGVAEEDGGIRLDRWVKRHFPTVPNALLQKLLRKGAIKVAGRKAEANARLEIGQEITLPDHFGEVNADTPPPRPRHAVTVSEQEGRDLQKLVLYKDADLLIINKPSGLAVQGGSGQSRHLDGMLDALRFDAKERPKLVHRLDKDTSGVLLLARSRPAAAELARRFATKNIEKTYLALVIGVPIPPSGRITLPLAKLPRGKDSREQVEPDEDDGKPAITDYRVRESMPGALAWVELSPITGRTHQLRVHMAALGHPIVGDGKYGGAQAFVGGSLGLSQDLHLHAERIVIENWRGKRIDVKAKLPKHMAESMKSLGD